MAIQSGTLTSKGAQTRTRILAAASRLMFENGVADTRVEDVREEAGVSNSQIYHYFADKAALVRAVIDYQTDEVVGPQEQLFADLDTMAGLWKWRDFVVEHQIRLQCRGGCPIAALAGQLAESDEAARLQLAYSFSRWSAGLRRGLASMHQAGRLREEADPEGLAVFLLSALQGGLLLTQLQREIAPIKVALDNALAHVEAQTV